MPCHAKATGDVSAPMEGRDERDVDDVLLEAPKPARAVPDRRESRARVMKIDLRFM